MTTEKLVSRSEYARMRGCTPWTVYEAVKSGRISLVRGKIDPAKADAEWAANTRARGDSRPAGVRAEIRANEGAHPETPSNHPRTTPEDPDEAIDYAVARARREHFAAKLAEMEVEKVAGRLVERSAVEPAVFNAFRSLRDRVMATPRRVAPTVAPLSDLREIEAVVAEELRRAFADFERTFTDQLAARTAPAE